MTIPRNPQYGPWVRGFSLHSSPWVTFAALTFLLITLGCGRGTPATSDNADKTKNAGAALSGVVKDQNGYSMAGVQVQGCTKTVCLTDTTDGSGRFQISGFETPVHIAVKVPESNSAEPPRLEAITPLLLQDSVADVGTVYVEMLPPPVTLPKKGIGTVRLGDGISLKLNARELKWPPLANRQDQLAAKSVVLARVPTFTELKGEKLVAVYALYPFATKSGPKIPVSLPTKLPAGTKVRLRTINELDGTLSSPEPGISDGRSITSLPGTGISELTWLVISR